MAHEMSSGARRPMSFNVRRVESDGSGSKWHWSVYDEPHGRFIRDGRITGDQEKAERAARAAIAIMGGSVTEAEE